MVSKLATILYMSLHSKILSTVSILSLISSFFVTALTFSSIQTSAISVPIIEAPALKKTKSSTVYNISNNPISLRSSETKLITTSDLQYGSLSSEASYSISPTKGKKDRIYVMLNNYPASTVCVDGVRLNEQSSGSGLFNLSKISPAVGQFYRFWTPDYFGSCSNLPPSKDFLKFNFKNSNAYQIAITTTPLSDSDIYYNARSLPQNAQILIDGIAIVSPKDVFREFTQQDINDGRVSLQTSRSTLGTDSFTFNVSDRYYNITNEVYSFNIVSQSTGGTVVTQQPTTQTPAQDTEKSDQSTQSPKSETKSGEVLGVKEESSDYYVYGLKALSIRSDKLINLSSSLKFSKTSGARNSNFSIAVSNIVRIDPKLKDIKCELVQVANGKVFASGSVDENGKCVINWTPGSGSVKGKFSGLIQIVDASRDHTYLTQGFNLNLL